jgi:hypothetical protein
MAAKSNDTDLKDLLKNIGLGKLQLPQFQRSWVWDDTRICKLLESLLSGFPMGAVLNLEYGSVPFGYRLFTGVEDKYKTETPDGLILDGQQRLTTLFQTLWSKQPVQTCLPTNRDHEIKRYYYINIKEVVKDNADILDCILSLPENKKLKENIGRDVKLDLTTRALEIENCYFPINLIYDQIEERLWQIEFMQFYSANVQMIQLYNQFVINFINPLQNYKLPVIQLDKSTKKEAVCQIFENVNTGGMPLTVFELVTAIFAAEGHNLREDWEEIKTEFNKLNIKLLKNIEPHYFLMAMSLLVSYQKNLKGESAVTCKKRDILRMTYADYKQNHDILVQGFKDAANFVVHLGIYSTRNIPYETQLIPLAAIFAYDNSHSKILNQPHGYDKLAQWYWCGVFGELYGGANETRFAKDIFGVLQWLSGGKLPDTINDAHFNATRLLSLCTRNSAAYKGVMAVITKDIPLDFMSGKSMDVAAYLDEQTDIHHIYPEIQCTQAGYPAKRWNSVINKTPIYASSNRSIGGRLPSQYLVTMKNKGLVDIEIDTILLSHKINPVFLRTDDFWAYTKDRATRLLDRIEKAMGKSVDGRDSIEIISEFGEKI